MKVVFDMDGVLADVREYLKEYLPHDWKGYFSHTLEFPPIPSLVDLLYALQRVPNNSIYTITGRPESNRKATEEWLYFKLLPGPPLTKILMRSNGDSRPTYIIKMEWLRDIRPDLVIDDDPEVAEAAMKEGFIILQVHGFRSTLKDAVPTNYL